MRVGSSGVRPDVSAYLLPAVTATLAAILSARVPQQTLLLVAGTAVIVLAATRPHVAILLALAPLVFFGRDGGYFGLSSVGVPIADALLAATAAALIARRIVRGAPLHVSRIVVMPLGFLAAYSAVLVLVSTSGSVLDRIREAAPGAYGFLAVIAVGLLWEHEQAAVLVWFRRMAAVAAAVWTFRGASNLVRGIGVYTTSGEFRALGADAAVYLVVAAFLLRTSPSPFVRRTWWWPLVGVAVTQHRSMFLALMITGAVAVVRARPDRILPRVIGAVGVLALLGPISATIPIARDSVERFSSLTEGTTDPNIDLRYESARSVFEASGREIIFGRGVGLQRTATQAEGEVSGDQVAPVDRSDIHNFVLESVRRGGLVSAALVLLPILAVLSAGLRRKIDPWWPSVLTIAVFALSNVVLEGNYMGIVFWIVLALAARAHWEASLHPDYPERKAAATRERYASAEYEPTQSSTAARCL